MPPYSRVALSSLCLALASVLAGCTGPPDKEMHGAQGAIDTARAAGADRYAADIYASAVAALSQSQQAVEEGDYRLALSHALDAREQAVEAARLAANQKANVRSEAERALEDVEATMAELAGRLRAGQEARIPADRLARARLTKSALDTEVQEARAELAREDYLGARERIEALTDRLRSAIEEIDAALSKP